MPILRKRSTITAINENVEVYLPPNTSAVGIQVEGTYTGALTLQVKSPESGVWVSLTGPTFLNVSTGAMSATIASGTQGLFLVGVTGFTNVRVIALAAVTGTATVSLQPTPAPGATSIISALPAGTNAIGSVTTTPASPTSAAVVTAASTNAAVVKSSAGTVYNVSVSNVTATATFVKLYNKSTSPTVGTDVPLITIPVPANTTVNFDIGSMGARFSSGIGRAVTAAAPATDTAVAVAGVQVLVTYI